MNVLDRFLKYVKVSTASNPKSDTNPSSMRQFDLAKILEAEMKEMGIQNVRLSDTCYVYGEIPATAGYEDKMPIGFIAHMDTAPEFNGEGVTPQVFENYDGSDILLKGSGHTLSPEEYEKMKEHVGKTLITTDGTTLLGADDKAGIAEILAMAEELLKGEIPHGKVCIGFTPDEEIGRGPDNFDVPNFGCNFAYTVDGGSPGMVSYENFNASAAVIEIDGYSIHPGASKNRMVNSILLGQEINAMLPAFETPAHTENREGFYHLNEFEGGTEHTRMGYILRDHDSEILEKRKQILTDAVEFVNKKYGKEYAKITITEQYKNMAEQIKPHMHLIDNAKTAAEAIGLEGKDGGAVRGGTDGSQLSYMGLPCPNLGTGGYNAHGRFEYAVLEEMVQCAEILLGIVKEYAK